MACLIIGALSWFAPRPARPLHTWLRTGLVISLCLLTFKLALVRDDIQHVARGLGVGAVMAWAIPMDFQTTFRNRLTRVGAGISTLLAMSLTMLLFSATPVSDPIDQWWEVARLLSPDRRAAVLEANREWIQVVNPLSPAVEAAVEGQRVIMEPVEVATAWAHDLDWAPVPVLQSYTAFTPALDRMNARDLVSDPDRVMLREGSAIDARNPLWDSPLYNYVIACRFIPSGVDPTWVVLTHTDNRCGRGRPGAPIAVRAGEPISIPQVEPNQLLTASFRPDPLPIWRRTVAELWRSIDPLFITVDETAYRLPRAHAAGPLILNLPDEEDVWQGPEIPPQQLTSSSPGTVRFTITPVQPSAQP